MAQMQSINCADSESESRNGDIRPVTITCKWDQATFEYKVREHFTIGRMKTPFKKLNRNGWVAIGQYKEPENDKK